MSQTIFEKYGGYEPFHKIIYELYLELFDHPEISYHFLGVDIERLSNLQAQYLCQAIGGGNLYKGRPVQPVHASMGISEFQFNVVAKRFARIFQKHGFTKDEIKLIMAFIGGHRQQIVTVKMTWIDRVMKPIYSFIYDLRNKIKGIN